MNERIASIICPNCGANSSNHKKCDFCGSVLVRFADKSIDNLEEKFGKRARIIPGLDSAFEENLRLQETIDDNSMVITSVFPIVPPSLKDGRFWYSKTVLGSDEYQIVSSRDTFWGCTNASNRYDEIGLSIRLPFAINSPLPTTKQIVNFSKKMESFNTSVDTEGLFTAANYEEGIVYGLYLGQDPESASRIATWYFNAIESNIDSLVRNRSVFSFAVKTEVVAKDSATFDDVGNIILKEKALEKNKTQNAVPQVSSSGKKSFWKRLLG